jgi:hypothetical protein
MAKQIIDRGTVDDPKTGDSLYEGAGKINDNFTELYDRPVGGGGGSLEYSRTDILDLNASFLTWFQGVTRNATDRKIDNPASNVTMTGATASSISNVTPLAHIVGNQTLNRLDVFFGRGSSGVVTEIGMIRVRFTNGVHTAFDVYEVLLEQSITQVISDYHSFTSFGNVNLLDKDLIYVFFKGVNGNEISPVMYKINTTPV